MREHDFYYFFFFFLFTFSITSCFDVFSRSEYLSLDFSPYLITLPYILARSLPFSRRYLSSLISLNYIQLSTLHISRSLESPTRCTYIYSISFLPLFPSHNHKSRGKEKLKLRSQSCVDARQFRFFSEIFLLRGASFASLGKKTKNRLPIVITPRVSYKRADKCTFSRYSDLLISSYSNELMRVTINTNLSFTVNYRICNHITSRLLRYIV